MLLFYAVSATIAIKRRPFSSKSSRLSLTLVWMSLPKTFIFKSKKEVSLSEAFALFNWKEQDKSFDIEQQPSFGDRKMSNTQPQNRGGGGVYKTNRNII